MDKRIEATLERVYHAYFKEKKKKSISEIKVIDICKWAEINKTTFYRHFRDIYDLADWAENQLIEEMISHYQHMDQLLSHPEIYIEENGNQPAIRRAPGNIIRSAKISDDLQNRGGPGTKM